MKNTVLISGGLGNQLFQYTFMLYLKKKLNADVTYNCSSIDFYKIHTGFQANLVFDFSEYEKDNRNFYSGFHRGLRKIKKKLGIKKSFNFCSDRMFDNKEKLYPIFEGFWQKAKFYEFVKPELKKAFKDLSVYCSDSEFVQQMNDTESVMLHIRRGDYLKDSSYADLSGTEYYQKAIEYFKGVYEKPVFFVFSDDVKWCREYFKEYEDLVFVEYENQTALSDLYLMHQCKNAIVANSSFSWWGAALDTKKVVARPTNYHVCTDTNVLYPCDWVAIEG